MRAASIRGVLHRNPRHPGPRQDAYALAARPSDQTLVGVVCDGIGSMSHSHTAANLVATKALEFYLEGQSWHTAIHEANSLLNETITQGPAATTVVALAAQPRPDGIWVDAASVGDSELLQLRDSGWARILPLPSNTPVDPDEVATGRTKALPSPRLQVQTWSGLVEDAPLFLMTDGVALPLDMSAMVKRTLADWWATAPSGVDFARQVGFAKATFIDDRTVVGFWPTHPIAAPVNSPEP
ncbi:MAG: protein phosphatase 2C domain-containing protein [Candidatus Phosphoribacter sp.]